MRNELGQRPLERAFPEQDELGKAFLFHRSHPSLRESIQIWAARRKAERPNALRCQHIVECRTELDIQVVQHVTALPEPSRRVVDGVARHLSHPGFGGMACDAGKSDAPALQINEEKDVVGGEPTPGQNLDCEEVAAGKHRHVRGDEILPCGGLAAFRRWCDAVAFQHVPDSLVGDLVAESGNSAGDPIVAPAAVLLRHANDQRFDLGLDARPSWIGTMFGSIELTGDQATVPTENRLGLGDTRDIGKEVAAEPFANFSQCAPLRVGEPDFGGEVRAQDPVLCGEVFALEEQALVHQHCHEGQQPYPAIVLHTESTW